MLAEGVARGLGVLLSLSPSRLAPPERGDMQDKTTPGALLTAMRTNPPLVLCITNLVATAFAETEVGEFAAISGALSIGWIRKARP
ncbi:hypothetical protein NXC24_PC00635 (plasmid) [Rhizobium sp. NXC24]|nr:hypothetical protein NXC24_PC00635 [Rhizobium sp. NXC24]